MAVVLNKSEIDETKTKRSCFFGQRHVVTLAGFLSFFLLSSNRVVLGVSIVAMVKHIQINTTSMRNESEISCPMQAAPSKLGRSNLEGEFDWSTELQGYLLGAGFLSYIMTQVPSGRLADAFNSKALLVYSNAMTGILTIISPFAARWHIFALITTQFLRGASQGVTTPAIYKMMSNWIPKSERGTLNTLSVCGYSVGMVVCGIITGWVCDIPQLGWPFAYYLWGSFCVLIAIVTQFIYFEHPVDNPWITDEELKYITDQLETKVSEKKCPTPWKKILTSIPCYAYFYGLSGHMWGLSYFVTVHPTYMGTILHFSTAEAGLTSCLPILISTFSGVLTSIISHWVTKKNMISINHLRKITTGVGALGHSLCMAGIIIVECDIGLNILFFALSLFSRGIAISGIMISGVDMAPAFAGSVMGVANTVAGCASFLNPFITGFITKHETLPEWQIVFWINLALMGSSGLFYVLFGSAEVQPWNYPDGVPPTDGKKEERKERKQPDEFPIQLAETYKKINT